MDTEKKTPLTEEELKKAKAEAERKRKARLKAQAEKNKYFEFYDDVKHDGNKEW